MAGRAGLAIGLALSAAAAPASVDPSLSAYARARTADGTGQAGAAARDYHAALDAAPDSPVVAIRAYREGLKAGDLPLADQAAAALTRLGAAPDDAALQPLAMAAQTNDLPRARAALAVLAKGSLAPLVPALSGWVALAEGRDPFAALAAAGTDPVARRLAAQSRALLLVATGHDEDGVAAVRALAGARGSGPQLRLDAARILFARHRAGAARALLVGDDPVVERLRAHPRGAKPTLGFGVARLCTLLGLELADGEGSASVVALARAALRADPGDDRARLLLADQLPLLDATGPALDVLAGTDPRGPYAGIARTLTVTVLQQAGDAATALAAAARLAQAKDASPYDIQRYGEALVAARRPEAAAAEFRRLSTAPDAGWGLWLEYGGALDAAGRWPEARAALERAVALGPDEPLALNYLGYARLQHGEEVAASEAMLERAARLKPGDPSITDSLAWAWFRRGAVARALPLFEQAAAGEPGNAEIAEHLGDAYWAAGRRFEARYAWRAATVADPAAAGRLAAKIDSGPAGQAAPAGGTGAN